MRFASSHGSRIQTLFVGRQEIIEIISGLAILDFSHARPLVGAATGWEQALLAILPTKPCLSIHLRLTSNRNVISAARLVSPAGRYRLEAIR